MLKPSLSTPLSALVFVELLEEAGIKEGWCQLLICDDSLTEEIAASDLISFLSFIGSETVGWKLKASLQRVSVVLWSTAAQPSPI